RPAVGPAATAGPSPISEAAVRTVRSRAVYREASLKAVMLRFDMEPLLGGQSLQIACGKEVEHPQENALESAVCAPGSGRPVVRKSAASGRLSGRSLAAAVTAWP